MSSGSVAIWYHYLLNKYIHESSKTKNGLVCKLGIIDAMYAVYVISQLRFLCKCMCAHINAQFVDVRFSFISNRSLKKS